jgi:hypothetical protein
MDKGNPFKQCSLSRGLPQSTHDPSIDSERTNDFTYPVLDLQQTGSTLRRCPALRFPTYVVARPATVVHVLATTALCN